MIGSLDGEPLISELLSRCVFPDAVHLDVAVSGGADSVALLALAIATGHDVTGHHVDHGLRPGGLSEAAAVEELCRSWGAEFVGHSVDVDPGGDLERRCRDARHGALPANTLMGHTADDLAETIVLRLLRGTGPDGLVAMRLDRHPLLELRRCDTEALCERLGVEPFRDPTNTDPRFRRNRVRSEVLPLLNDVAGRDVVPLLVRLSKLAAAQSAFIAGLAADLDPRDARALREAPEPVAVQALRVWWTDATGGLPVPDVAAVQRMMAVVRGTVPACDVLAGWRLHRTRGRLRLVSRDERGEGTEPG